ncbi:MAG: phosphatase PAP2 family protein [Chitinophagaceae bacterium]|nr:MAG: phosphatase PAP2 family protein [Chitinophagaceae bacterium]
MIFMRSNNHQAITAFYRRILPLIFFILSLLLFVWIAHEVVLEQEDLFDSRAFGFFKAYSNPDYIPVFKAFTFLGSSTFLLGAYCILIVWLFIKKKKRDGIGFGLLGIAGFVLVYFLKLAFARHRPGEPLLTALENYSFPSGHSVGSLLFFGILTWEIWQSAVSRKWKWALTVLFVGTTLMVGVSRIVLRYHYASDVVGGFSLGLALLILFLFLLHIRKA